MKGEGKCNMGEMMKLVVFYLAFVLAAFLPGCFVVGDQELKWRKQAKSTPPVPALVGSSAVYPVLGNVYPVGYYYVDIRIGYPPKPFFLDIDTGSDLTWLHCDAPCLQCPKIMKDLTKTPLQITASDETLSICWKGAKAFKSIADVKKYFKPVILSFTNGKKAQRMEIPPESYLIISEFGNVCSGILNGTEIGLEDLNLIGDNFFQDRMVIYDNEKQEIGWATANCDRLPNIDREEEDLSQLDTGDLDILTEDYGPGASSFQKEYEESHKEDELRK
ncbi:hypothetical protein MKW92_000346 [Papaver armeniacum]|nr:hypothetical protein MKW92_000346 [Papaver armeniacum]